MRTIAKFCAALLVFVATGAAALAQTSGSSQCAQPQGSGGNLSRQLKQSNGVICPPQMDPGMKRSPPNEGTTPVIPPPGTPGGNPDIQPK
jgi:hypothetical protein